MMDDLFFHMRKGANLQTSSQTISKKMWTFSVLRLYLVITSILGLSTFVTFKWLGYENSQNRKKMIDI